MAKTPGNLADRQRGVMFGLAYGDALGRPTEFITGKTLAKFGSPFQHHVGITRPDRGIVTDDTQMSIAVAKAALGSPDPEHLTHAFVDQFIGWYIDPKSKDGKRAPGMTCLSAVGQLVRNPWQWLLATDPGSKGNGANMRVAPLALRSDWTWPQMAQAAQLQAAITHGHSTALAAADITATAVRMLLEGVAKPGQRLLDHLIAYAEDQRTTYYGDALGDLWKTTSKHQPFLSKAYFPKGFTTGRLWEDDPSWPIGAFVKVKPRRGRPAPETPEEYISRGWDKIIDCLYGIYDVPRIPNQDPCDVAGSGWVAEEAITCALHTLITFPDDPTNALRRAAFTDGDSDSIASITGALAGAAYGRSAFPGLWLRNIEYRSELDSLAAKLAAAACC